MNDIDPEQLQDLFSDHDVAFAYLFGSRAEAAATPRSDHDVAVMFHGGPTLRQVGRLQESLVRLVGTSVDLVELDRATLELRARVIQTGTLLFSDDEKRRVAFETHTRSRWFDYRPTMDELTRAYLHRVATRGL